jgi:hypothetical protein
MIWYWEISGKVKVMFKRTWGQELKTWDKRDVGKMYGVKMKFLQSTDKPGLFFFKGTYSPSQTFGLP